VKITIRRFKSILEAELELQRINVLVDGNNAGKSSVLQAIQFAVSCAQTIPVFTKAVFKHGSLPTSLSPEQLFYSPIKEVYQLGHRGELSSKDTEGIQISLNDDVNETSITIVKGRNKNISIRIVGDVLGLQLQNINQPYSMYVPGLAGIPFEEQFIALGGVRRAAAKGDSNHIFRNVLLQLHDLCEQWNDFISILQTVFPNINLDVKCDMDNNPVVDVTGWFGEESPRPIDAMGTGILQAIQICAYIYLFKPKLLLLDEPDAHLHPQNQISLAALLTKISERMDTHIILATHSRTLVSALKDSAKFFRMANGSVSTDEFDIYATMLELGALDDLDKLQNGQYKWVVLTEDTTSLENLKYILEASGLQPADYRVYSYASSGRIEAAKITANFICGLHSDIKVLIHADRDGRTPTEIQKLKQETTGLSERTHWFVTEGNDIESYYCRKQHIATVLGTDIGSVNLDVIVNEAIQRSKAESIEKLINNRTNRVKNYGKFNAGQCAAQASIDWTGSPLEYSYGHKLPGEIAILLQTALGHNVNLFVPSTEIKDQYLLDLFNPVPVE
jgi:energy-coupling factor transporter ATP-binding protein EcfA2